MAAGASEHPAHNQVQRSQLQGNGSASHWASPLWTNCALSPCECRPGAYHLQRLGVQPSLFSARPSCSLTALRACVPQVPLPFVVHRSRSTLTEKGAKHVKVAEHGGGKYSKRQCTLQLAFRPCGANACDNAVQPAVAIIFRGQGKTKAMKEERRLYHPDVDVLWQVCWTTGCGTWLTRSFTHALTHSHTLTLQCSSLTHTPTHPRTRLPTHVLACRLSRTHRPTHGQIPRCLWSGLTPRTRGSLNKRLLRKHGRESRLQLTMSSSSSATT